jgi:uncharacterized protein YuzE
MRLTCDPAANVAYIRLREPQGDVETISVTADFHVDTHKTGAVCGIELLKVKEQLTASDDGKLIVVNDLSGEQGEMKVA